MIVRLSSTAAFAAVLALGGLAASGALAAPTQTTAAGQAFDAAPAKVQTVSNRRRRGFGRRPHRNWRWPNTRITKPTWVNCAVEKDFDEGGSAPYSIVRFTNASSHTLPAGSVIQFTLSNGHTATYKLYHPLAPGQKSIAVDVPVNGYNPALSCSAFVQKKIRYLPSSRLPGSIH